MMRETRFNNLHHTIYSMRLIKITFFIFTLSLTSLYANFAGGDGTENNPYQISTIEQLNQVRGFNDQNFILVNDLDFLGTPYDSANSAGHKGWEPINDFSGIFNGDSFVINNLYIMRPDEDSVGLFGYQSGSVVKLGLKNVKVNGRHIVGGLVGDNDGEIDLCYVIGSISGSRAVGGIAGGSLYLANSFSNGNVNGHELVGGVVGYSHTSIYGCYSNSSVDGYEYVGGLLGFNAHYDYIEDCDAIGWLSGEVFYSYSTGKVSGHNYVGGLVGANNANIFYSYTNSIIEVKRNDSIPEDERKIAKVASFHVCTFSNNVYYNRQLNEEIKNTGGLGYDSLDFRDSSLVRLDYVDPSDTLTGFIYNPNGFPYLNWQNPDDLPLNIKKSVSNNVPLNLNFFYQDNLLQISFNKIQNSTLSIYSLTGNLIASNKYYSSQINRDLSGMTSGIYVVKLVNGSDVFSSKILVQ